MLTLILLYAVNFLRTLAIIAIIYFGLRFIRRYVLPLLIAKGVKNMQQKMQDQQRANRPGRPEGEVTVEENQTKNNTQAQNKGDYVDFEEVD